MYVCMYVCINDNTATTTNNNNEYHMFVFKGTSP